MTRHLLLIGAQRSGTTSVHHGLDAHPRVAMARPFRPEPKVFLDDEVLRRGREWYVEGWFDIAEREHPPEVLGEKSTSYIEVPAAAERAAKVLGDDVYVLAQLRDPIDRAISNWRFSTENGLENRPLEQALTENLTAPREWDPQRSSVSPYAYVERGRYAEHLLPWLDRFGETMRVQFLAELYDDAVAATDDTLRWLGLDPAERGRDEPPAANTSNGHQPGLSGDLVRRLRDYYADSDAELAALLGLNPPWVGTGTGGQCHRSDPGSDPGDLPDDDLDADNAGEPV